MTRFRFIQFFPLWLAAASMAFGEEPARISQTPPEIKITRDTDVDIVFHCLAYFQLPGNPANLYSSRYLQQIQKAKQDLETGKTRLDLESQRLGEIYRKCPALQFLNLALFMADDFASFKQAMSFVDLKPEELEDPQETLAQRRERDKSRPLLFGNARRLIPVFQKHFPEVEEREFLKLFSACMEDEYNRFYRSYRESRQELDDAAFEVFSNYWKDQGLQLLSPWISRAKMDRATIYLCPVMKTVGRGVPVTEEREVHLNIVAPLPENPEEALQSGFIILHETVRRVTDDWVEPNLPKDEAEASKIREFAAFTASRIHIQKRFPSLYAKFLKFFLNLPAADKRSIQQMENDFSEAYPLPPLIHNRILDKMNN